MPTPRASGGTNSRPPARATIRPPIRISPSSGASKPAMSRSVVVLPQPEGPTSPRISPPAAASARRSDALPPRRGRQELRGEAVRALRAQVADVHRDLAAAPLGGDVGVVVADGDVG